MHQVVPCHQSSSNRGIAPRQNSLLSLLKGRDDWDNPCKEILRSRKGQRTLRFPSLYVVSRLTLRWLFGMFQNVCTTKLHKNRVTDVVFDKQPGLVSRPVSNSKQPEPIEYISVYPDLRTKTARNQLQQRNPLLELNTRTRTSIGTQRTESEEILGEREMRAMKSWRSNWEANGFTKTSIRIKSRHNVRKP